MLYFFNYTCCCYIFNVFHVLDILVGASRVKFRQKKLRSVSAGSRSIDCCVPGDAPCSKFTIKPSDKLIELPDYSKDPVTSKNTKIVLYISSSSCLL